MLRFCAAVLFLFLAAQAFGDEFTGKVVGVVDGDTIDVLRDGKWERVRLEGIDCPEKGQASTPLSVRFRPPVVATLMLPGRWTFYFRPHDSAIVFSRPKPWAFTMFVAGPR